MKSFSKPDLKNTEILVITDRSGSMSNIAADIIGGYNTFIADQKTVPGAAKVTFVQFDDQYEIVYAGKELQEVPLLDHKTFVPRGSTALLDAIGKTLVTQGERIEKEAWADLVVVYILTDGRENASKEYQLPRIKELTSAAEGKGWTFVYLGANQDSFSVVSNLGLSRAITQNYTANAAGACFAYASMSTTLRDLRN